MRRTMLVAVLTAALMIFTAGPAFAAHCVNLSKKADAGNHTDVIINGITEEVTITALNGGYADVWLDVDGNGTPDVLLDADVQIGRNHSPKYADAEAWVNPGAIHKAMNEHATDEHGMGFRHHD